MAGIHPDEWPLRGRDDELRATVDALDGRGGVLLAGPAGVGKTRLAREALAGRRGAVRVVRATESSRPLPLGALAPLIAATAGGAPAQLLAAAHAALRAEPGLVLGIDDAHLLDEVSATLVHQLVGDRAVRLVATVRTGEAAPAAVTALWKDGLLPRIDVEALSADRTVDLLEAALGGRVHSDSGRRLHAATSGNVLWLRELVAGERRDGRLARTEGLWTWAGEPRLTPGLTELIAARIGALDDGVRPVVELLALAEPLDLDVLAALTGPAAVDEAVARGLVAVARPEARLAHPLYGDVVRARVGEPRARALRGRVVTALADAGHEDLLRRAALALGSDLAPDPKLLTTAADRAIALNDIPLAVRLLEAACAAGAEFDAHVTLAYTLSYLLRPQEAERAFEGAVAHARTPAQVARLAQMQAVHHLFVLGEPAAAERIAAAAERTTGHALLGFRATAATLGNRLDEAGRHAARLAATDRPPAHAAALAGWARTAVAGLTGRTDALRGIAVEATTAALASPETATLQTNIAFVEVFGLALAGRPAAIRGRIEELSTALQGLFPAFMLPVFDGLHALTTGDAGLAARRFVEYRPYFPGAGGGYTTWFEGLRAVACGIAGDAAGAAESLARAEQHRLPSERVFGPLLDLARAWSAAADGAVSTAAASAVEAAEHAAASGQWAVEVLARHDATLLGSRTQAPRLRELVRRVDGPRAGLAAAHAEALAARDADALTALSLRFEEAGLLLGAAEAAAHAAGLLRRRGEAAQHGAALRATALATSCGIRSPGLQAVARPLPLSARQREIAVLAARLSNTEIAQRLGVSVRTVEGHVYHACVRLGLANRAELAAHVTEES
ncbi:LuxR C-terminal-related transcriptional regulator [Pseudonocardia sp.]|uniref:LuxR C-terminal-related transcriptional regulator n=1 Tax=Pseudonocardia sp. TaxID=60912 RepID=UPI003D0A8B41